MHKKRKKFDYLGVLVCATFDIAIMNTVLAQQHGAHDGSVHSRVGYVHAAACMCMCGARVWVPHVSKGREEGATVK
jgi:hypothetical protein